MNIFRTLAAAALFFGLLTALPAAEPSKPDPLNALEKKLVGTWIGQGGCVGDAVFQEDGTYHCYGYGPFPSREIGRWKIEWNALPPTLILEPWPTDGYDSTKPQRLILVTLNDKEFNFRYEGFDRVAQHTKGTASDDVKIRIKVLDSGVQRYLGNKQHGAGVKLPPDLKTLVDTNIIRSPSLLDPWGKEFHYDVAGKRNQGKRPDIWAETKDGKVIGNWMDRD